MPVAGTVVVGDPTNATLMGAATQCTGRPTHTAIWLLNVTAAGQSLPAPVPLYVDPATGSAFASFASTIVILCLPHPSLATFKIKLLTATLHVTSVFDNPATPGSYRWTGINTPWKPDTPAPNPAGTIETQSIERTPIDASFNAKLVTKTKRVKHGKHVDLLYSYSAQLSGGALAGGEPATNANVDLFAGTKKIGTATTNDNGTFRKTVALSKTTTFHAAISQDAQTVPGATCEPPLPAASRRGPSVRGDHPVRLHGTTADKTVKKPKRKEEAHPLAWARGYRCQRGFFGSPAELSEQGDDDEQASRVGRRSAAPRYSW